MKKLWFVALLSFASAQVPVTAFGFDAKVGAPAGTRIYAEEDCEAYFEASRGLWQPTAETAHVCYATTAEAEVALYFVKLEMITAGYELAHEQPGDDRLLQGYYAPDGTTVILTFFFHDELIVISALSGVSF